MVESICLYKNIVVFIIINCYFVILYLYDSIFGFFLFFVGLIFLVFLYKVFMFEMKRFEINKFSVVFLIEEL